MLAGTLIVDIAANTARLAKDMAEAKGVVQSSMKSIEASVNIAKTALGALGVGLGVSYFAGLVKGAIDAADHLNDLSKTTAISVEQLAGLKMAAKQSGGDLDGLAQSISKLSVNMGKDAEKFKALGISAKDPLEAFKQLSDIFVAIQDPQQRAAVMAAALGKTWQSAAPLLAEGGEKIGQMVGKGAQLAGVTKEMAEEADRFNDSMVELNTTLGSTTTRVLGPLLPGMNQIAEAMAEAAKEGGLLLTVWVALGGAMANVLGMTETQKTAKRLGEIAGELEAARKRLQAGSTNPEGANSHFFSFLVPDIKVGEEQLAKVREVIKGLEAERAKLSGGSKPGDDASWQRRFDEQTRRQAALGWLTPEQQAAAERAAAFLAAEADKANAASEASKAEAAARKEAKEALDAYNKSLEQTAKNEDALTKAREEGAAVEAEAALKRGEALTAGYKLAEQIEFETSLIGKSNAEREVAIALRNLETKGIRETDEAYAGLAARMGAVIDSKIAREEAQKASEAAANEWKRAQESMWSSIDRTAHDTFVSIFESGKGAFTRLRDTLKNTLYDLLYQMTLRPFIVRIAASVGGAGGMGGAGSAFAGGGGSLLGGGGGFSGQGLLDALGGYGNTLLGTGGSINYGINSALGFTGAAGWGIAEEAAALGIGGLGTAGSAFSGLSFAGPIIGGALMAMQGNVAGGIGSTIGGIAGSYFGPVGTAVGSFLGGQIGGLFGGGEEKVPHAKGSLRVDDEGNFYIKFADVEGIAQEEMKAPDILALNAALNDPRQYDPELLKAIVGQVVQGPRGAPGTATLEKLGALFAPAQTSAQEYTAKFNASLGGTGVLSAGIAGYVGSMSVSEYLSPEQRLAGARSMYDTALASAGSGDALASQALPGLANQLLGAGRTFYASGPQFQDLWTQVNNDMAGVLDQQAAAQEALLAELPSAFREANFDVVAAIKTQTEALRVGLERLNSGLRALGGSATPSFGGA